MAQCEDTRYEVKITEEEADAIQFSGGRYAWSDILQRCIVEDEETGQLSLELSEHEAWEFNRAADEDGAVFPLAGPQLVAKLTKLWADIV